MEWEFASVGEYTSKYLIETGLMVLAASPPGTKRNTYKSIRIMGEGYNLYYSVWCSDEHDGSFPPS